MGVDSQTLAMLEEYNKGLKLYRKREFSEALKCFEKAIELRPGDGPSGLYIKRCKDYIKTPPDDDWDGVYEFTTK